MKYAFVIAAVLGYLGWAVFVVATVLKIIQGCSL